MSAQEADDGQTQHGPHGSALDFGIHLSGIGVGGASRGGKGGHFWGLSYMISSTLQIFGPLSPALFAPQIRVHIINECPMKMRRVLGTWTKEHSSVKSLFIWTSYK